MSAALHLPLSRMTRDEFLSWDGPGQQRWQLVDGGVVAMAPTSEPHGALVSELCAVLRNHFVQSTQPCRVIAAPGVVPRVRGHMNHRIPDIGVTCASPSQGYEIREPVALIEVLSPSNEAQTRANV